MLAGFARGVGQVFERHALALHLGEDRAEFSGELLGRGLATEDIPGHDPTPLKEGSGACAGAECAALIDESSCWAGGRVPTWDGVRAAGKGRENCSGKRDRRHALKGTPEVPKCPLLRLRELLSLRANLKFGSLGPRPHLGFVRHERAMLGQGLDFRDSAGPGELPQSRLYGRGK